MKTPVIFNFDQSVNTGGNEIEINLIEWQEVIRFGCSMRKLKQFKEYLDLKLPNDYGTVLLGSGDYHHVSLLLIERFCHLFSATNPIQVVIFDNHPGNMRYLFGIHCGSWVSYVASLPFVSHIHVIGITSPDIGISKLWENRLWPLLKGKLTYWSMDVNVSWSKFIGLGKAFRHFHSPEEMITTFLSEQCDNLEPVYLSIDKDVLSCDVGQTNLDQGRLDIHHILDTIAALDKRIIGSDIIGDVAIWHYKSVFKWVLSAFDKQPNINVKALSESYHNQQRTNTSLLKALHNN